MGGLYDTAIIYYELRGMCNFLLVATWGVYPDLVFCFPCVVYSVLF